MPEVCYASGMGFFITERQTEEYLETETRDVPLADGSARPVTAFKLLWRSWDYLILCGGYGRRELAALAQINACEVGCSFEDSLRDTLAHLHRDLRRKQGMD